MRFDCGSDIRGLCNRFWNDLRYIVTMGFLLECETASLLISSISSFLGFNTILPDIQSDQVVQDKISVDVLSINNLSCAGTFLLSVSSTIHNSTSTLEIYRRWSSEFLQACSALRLNTIRPSTDSMVCTYAVHVHIHNPKAA